MDLKTKLSNMIEQVRSNPDNQEHRLALIQYLCLCAKWDQALKQIGQYQKLFPNIQKPLMLYLIENIEAEMRREAVLTAKQKPKTLEQHASKLDILQKQLSLVADVAEQKSAALADGYAALSDNIDETPVNITYLLADKSVADASGSWIMDGDVRTAFVYEYFYRGHYYWQPWSSIESISFKAPSSLLDVVWRPSEITFSHGECIQCTSPARYAVLPDTEAEWSDMLLQCAQTDWIEAADQLFTGLGQKMLYTDNNDFGLLDIKTIKFEQNH
ncbi:type VI secretion system accessory protein TagJ [Neisseria sp. 83E34]|uniref:type VI secretion system accessory protein TagJ n=1 Tax=Neisseria sp. 83E34 TaxID=1692264 RepID=UPI0006CE7A55|nr:type VI secretion system accessory protein TagJ [Neisseria sp. 83E34]KPN70624.1 ImpE protein [Neisseria sp. 83E34]